MSTIFTEANRLIIQNWDIVKEIHKAEEDVNLRLREYLFAFESQLAQCDWWDTMWKFTPYQNMQFYISHSAWKRKDGYALWIGIENFSVESLFGTDTYPS